MIKSQTNDDFVEVEIIGNGENIAKELCSILDRLSQAPDTQLIVINAIANHITHLRTE